MSVVDNVIFSFDIVEDAEPRIAEVNAWLIERTRQQFGSELPGETYGGSKYLETPLYIAAFNHFPESDFLDFLTTLPWRCPQHVQYIVKRQNDDVFHIVSILGRNP